MVKQLGNSSSHQQNEINGQRKLISFFHIKFYKQKSILSINTVKGFLALTIDLAKDKYKRYPKKSLTNIIKTVMTLSRLRCMTLCSMTDGCLAVNVIGNHDITCELTSGLSKETEMQDHSSSRVFVLSKQ